MNTAGSQQAVNNDSGFAAQWLSFDGMKRWPIWTLAILVFISAMGVVYVTDLNRRLFINDQQLQAQNAEEQTQWGKLVLEQSTWSTQARVQRIAQTQLNMELPTPSQIVMVKVK